jgi:hypothetical protein
MVTGGAAVTRFSARGPDTHAATMTAPTRTIAPLAPAPHPARKARRRDSANATPNGTEVDGSYGYSPEISGEAVGSSRARAAPLFVVGVCAGGVCTGGVCAGDAIAADLASGAGAYLPTVIVDAALARAFTMQR